MTSELRRGIVLAGVGLLAGFALVVALFGTGELLKRQGPPAPAAPHGLTGSADGAGKAGPESPAAKSSAAKPEALQELSPGGPASPAARPEAPEAGTPSFDIVRVEPDGSAVVAGRAAPDSTVELLRDGQPFARVQADPAGQFALTPPDLPAGNSEITLRMTAPGGKTVTSRQSVVVVVAPKRDAKPLIALSSPDKPTVVLSQPEEKPGTGAAAGKPEPPSSGQGLAEARTPETKAAGKRGPGAAARPGTKPAAGANAGATAEAGPGGPVKIVSIDAQENGRLFVSAEAEKGSTLRLYLNDTLVASGQAGPDGRIAFTIGRGVRPGDYQIRVDQVDPASGKVRRRAAVAFAFPAPGPAPAPVAEAGSEPGRGGPARATGSNATPSPTREAAAAPEAGPGTGPSRPATPAADGKAGAPAPPRPAATAEAAAPRNAPGSVFVAEIGTARIIRGDSLWQISRRTYGRGDRYTVIYDANQQQIRDPDLIYPGQIFVLPKDAPDPAKRG